MKINSTDFQELQSLVLRFYPTSPGEEGKGYFQLADSTVERGTFFNIKRAQILNIGTDELGSSLEKWSSWLNNARNSNIVTQAVATTAQAVTTTAQAVTQNLQDLQKIFANIPLQLGAASKKRSYYLIYKDELYMMGPKPDGNRDNNPFGWKSLVFTYWVNAGMAKSGTVTKPDGILVETGTDQWKFYENKDAEPFAITEDDVSFRNALWAYKKQDAFVLVYKDNLFWLGDNDKNPFVRNDNENFVFFESTPISTHNNNTTSNPPPTLHKSDAEKLASHYLLYNKSDEKWELHKRNGLQVVKVQDFNSSNIRFLEEGDQEWTSQFNSWLKVAQARDFNMVCMRFNANGWKGRFSHRSRKHFKADGVPNPYCYNDTECTIGPKACGSDSWKQMTTTGAYEPPYWNWQG